MSSVALEELCQVRDNNPDDVELCRYGYLMLGLETHFNKRPVS